MLLKPLVAQLKDILETGRYKEDTPSNPFWANHFIRLINTMGCISRGEFPFAIPQMHNCIAHHPPRYALWARGKSKILERSAWDSIACSCYIAWATWSARQGSFLFGKNLSLLRLILRFSLHRQYISCIRWLQWSTRILFLSCPKSLLFW